MNSPLDWKAELLHPRSRDVQEEFLASAGERAPEAFPLRPGGPAEQARVLAEQTARAEVWDLPDPATAAAVAELAATVPYVDRIAPETVPAPYGLLRLPARADGDPPATGFAGHAYPATADFLAVAGRTLVETAATADGRIRTRVGGLAWAPVVVDAVNGGRGAVLLGVRRIVEVSSVDCPGVRIMGIEPVGLWTVGAHFAEACDAGPCDSFGDWTVSELLDGDRSGVTSTLAWERADALRFLLATWALAASEALDVEAVRDRPAARRARRAGSVNDKAVRVLAPRARSGGGDGSGTGGGVAAHWVRGHWRWQPVGEGRQDRRLTWVRAHTRGRVGEVPAAPREKVVTVRT